MKKSFSITDPLPGTRFTNDLVILNRVIMKLAENSGQCPCSIVIDADHQCPCLDYRNTLICKCGLYVKENV